MSKYAPVTWDDPAAGYREAAAVLAYFQPESLQPLPNTTTKRETALPYLLTDSTIVYDKSNKPQWMLQHGVRCPALQRMSTETIQSALNANLNRPQTTLQQMLEAYILDEAPPLEKQSLEQLTSTLQVVEWLYGVRDGLPYDYQVEQRIEWLRLLAPFHHLVGDHFRGRTRDLEVLRKYVGGLPAQGFIEKFSRGVDEIFSLHRRPPLLIFGPGGMGKSTLVSKFILQHVEVESDLRFPFTYIDFDRPGLLAERPETILLEALRQLAIQFPQAEAVCASLREEWIGIVAKTARPVGRKELFGFIGRFSETYHTAIRRPDRPYLLVLDTFEEVQYRSRDVVSDLFDVLNQLQEAIPRLRTVISGRAKVRAFETQEHELENLDRQAAIGFLNFKKVSDNRLARLLYDQVGGNPLSLALAAEVVELEGIGRRGIRDIRTRGIIQRLDDSIVQGQLYTRILGHVHNETVRKIAHPGLVLRFISAELIEQVLAEPCKLRLESAEHAQQLYDELSREVSLVNEVEFDGEFVLRHRGDVRRVMLTALTNDKPNRVYQIHRNAIRYYEQRTTVESRAEEIYHRLCSESDFALIDKRWIRGVENHLWNVLEEIPERIRPYLANRLGVEGYDINWDDAGQAEREQRAINRISDALARNRPEVIQEILSDANLDTYLPGSQLYLREAQALTAQERWQDAYHVAKSGVFSSQQTSQHDQLLRLFLLLVTIREKLANADGALHWLLDALSYLHKHPHEATPFVSLGLHLKLAQLAEQTANYTLAINALNHAKRQAMFELLTLDDFTFQANKQTGNLIAHGVSSRYLKEISDQLLNIYANRNSSGEAALSSLCRIHVGKRFVGVGIQVAPQTILVASAMLPNSKETILVYFGSQSSALEISKIEQGSHPHTAHLILETEREHAPVAIAREHPHAEQSLHLLNYRVATVEVDSQMVQAIESVDFYHSYLNHVKVVIEPSTQGAFMATRCVDDFVTRQQMHGAPIFNEEWELVGLNLLWFGRYHAYQTSDFAADTDFFEKLQTTTENLPAVALLVHN